MNCWLFFHAENWGKMHIIEEKKRQFAFFWACGITYWSKLDNQK